MLATPSLPLDVAMAASDRVFYEKLGQRLAERRKARGITQVQLAERLGVAQQTLAHYEGGTVRIAIATLANAAQALDTSIEALIGSATTKAGGKRGPAPKIQQQLEQIEPLPKAKQRVIAQVLNSMLASQHQMRSPSASPSSAASAGQRTSPG